MNHNMDNLIKIALSEKESPNPDLNRQILLKAKEHHQMKTYKIKKSIATAACICLAMVGSISAYAAYRYLSPSQVADRIFDNKEIGEAFASKDAIIINETQTTNGYNVTLLGLVTGENLRTHIPEETSNTLVTTNTYAVVAIEKADGSEMDYQGFCVSPLINGVDFMIANNASMNTLLSYFEQDGILYHLIECDNLEIFAGRGVQLGIVDNFGNETQAFYMDETTGVYHKQNGYEKTNALFTLPLDESKADEIAATAYIESLMDESEETTPSNNHYMWEVSLFIRSITPENIDEYFERDTNTELTAIPDETGWIDFGTRYNAEQDYMYEAYSGYLEYLIDDTEDFSVRGYGLVDNDLSTVSIRTIWRNEDGSFTHVIYRTKVDLSFLLEQ
ncbi:MAG: DUF4179 domain-containing protein [Agathobacter sp.]|nr:DUF4179 domain-containing protein [Agathobacter sp.]